LFRNQPGFGTSSINILGFRYFPLKGYHLCFHLREDTEKDFLLTDRQEMHFLDMARFRESGDKDVRRNAEHRWMRYLDPKTPEGEVEELIKMDAGIAKAQEMMDLISRDEGLLHSYHLYEMTLSDETSRINGARDEGKAMGLAEADAKFMDEKRQMARKLRERGVTVDIIAGSLNLPPELVESL
jgi:predicted transposase/invertase (TIGR01784 family)